MAEINDKFEFEQDGKTYSLYDLPDGFVIEGRVNLSCKGLTELPDLSKVIVKGDFNCSFNILTSLKGAPQEIGGDFRCAFNKLTSLEGAPQKVVGDFYCNDNRLISLEGAPQKTGRGFHCNDNLLTTLAGAPKDVNEGFGCQNNQLTTLEGAPQEIGGSFLCSHNKLATLKGAPQKVAGDFSCRENELISLEGAPQEVGGDFYCGSNPNLTSLLVLPKMPENKQIYCDDELKEKYKNDGLLNLVVYYKDVIASAKYQSELSAYKIRQRKKEENKTAQAQFKAGYAAFKKKQSEERE